MPAFLTHCLFSDDVLEKIEDDELKKEILQRKAVYYLGAQGPDIFFFYRSRPWQKNDGIDQLALRMHDSRTGDFFIESADYLKNYLKAGRRYYTVMTYMIGYICHYCLDKNTHPLIHYQSGIDTLKNKTTRKYHNFHKRYEALLDTYMLKKKRNLDAYRFKTYELVVLESRFIETLKSFYFYIINRVYKFDIKEIQVETAIRDTYLVLRSLHDPAGIKSAVYKIIENMLDKKDEITSLIYPRTAVDYGDFLNLTRKQWAHPCDEKLRFNYSLEELYNLALDEAVDLSEKFKGFITGKYGKSEIISKFNSSYSTGLACDTNRDLRFFNSVFEPQE